MIPIPRRAWALLLAAGCAWWTTLTLTRTREMAELCGTSEGEIRALGARDAVVGAALVVSRDPRPAMAARVLCDLSDAARFGSGRPKVLGMTLGFGVLGVLGFLTRRD